MRCNRWLSFVAILLLLGTSVANAATGYRWKLYSYAQPSELANQVFATGAAICSAVVANQNSKNNGNSYSLTSCQALAGTTGAPTAAGVTVTVRTHVHWSDAGGGNSSGDDYLYDTSGVSEAYDDGCTEPSGTHRQASTLFNDEDVGPGSEGCVGGCAVIVNSLITAMIGSAGGYKIYDTVTTGAACTSATNTAIDVHDAAEEMCFELGGQTVCTDPTDLEEVTVNGEPTSQNGEEEWDSCYDAADGGSLCVTQTGTTPSTPPAPNDGETSTTTPATPDVTVTNVTNNTNTTYYNSTTVAASDALAGSGSSSSASSGSSGSSSSASSGDSSGEGEDWYEKKDDTFGTVLNDFTTSVQGSAVFTQASGFFTMNLGGSCPVWSTTVAVFGTITIDQQCSATMNSIWPYIYAVVVATAAFYAFRIAFL